VLCSFIVKEDISFYKRIFKKVYCKKHLITFDGINVKFYVSNFDHTFYESKNRQKKDKSLFSYKRANRIYWIKWILESPNAELYVGYNSKLKKIQDNRRVALCIEEFVVVIELDKKNRNKAKFVTAYLADGVNGKGEKAIDLIRKSPKWK